MSSILEALKKLEQTTPRPGGIGGRSGSPYLSTGSKGHRVTSRTSKLLLVGTAGIIVIVAAAGAWYYFASQPRTVQPVASTPQPASIQQPAQPSPAPATATQSRPKPVEPRPSPPQSEPGSAISATVHKNTADSPAARKAVDTPPPQKAPPKPTQTTERAASSPSNTIFPATLPKLEDAKIKLQAISWTEIAAKRMAVINSKILREGDTVGGYEVKRIGEEGVVLSKEGTSWRLSIRLK